MTSTLAGPVTSPRAAAPERGLRTRTTITSLDLLAGGSLLVVALLAWASLTLAHLGAHSAPAAALLTAVGLAVVVGLSRRVRVRADWAGVAVALACAAASFLLTYPGFSYGVSDKDPGGYVSHAIEISRTGDYSFIDPLLAQAAQDPTYPVQLTTPGARFSGVWVNDASTGRIVPQFYHLWPALLATSYDAGGLFALRATVPLMGVLSVLLIVAVLRRAGDALFSPAGVSMPARAGPRGMLSRGSAGLVAGGAGGLLLATNMLQVWQTRFPTTEVLAQALFLGVLLGIVVALQTGCRTAAGLAGLFVGVGWLNRADGLLLVLMAAGVGAALLATRRWDGRSTWFAAGLLVVTPHALRQAYDFALPYSNANGIPSLLLVTAAVVGLFVVGGLLRVLAGRPLAWAQAGLEGRRTQVIVGTFVLLGATALLVLGFLRPTLFGFDYFDYNDRSMVRSYNEEIMNRLAWFISAPGFVLMMLGLAVVALRRWNASVWTVVIPTLVLFPLYGYTANNSTRLLWWSRRYVPTVLPGIVILLALVLAYLAVRRWRGQLPSALLAVGALAGLTTFFLSQSLELRQHDEWRGSFAVSERIAALSGDQKGIYLWEFDQGCCAGPTRLFATPVWLQHGELSGLLPSDASMQIDGNARTTVIERTAQAFPDRPVFLVAGKGGLPAGIDPGSVTPVDRFQVTLPMWEESDTERPDEVRQIPLDIAVWRVLGT